MVDIWFSLLSAILKWTRANTDTNTRIPDTKTARWHTVAMVTISKASYSIKPLMWNLATVPAWSDLIRVTLWRNNGFLLSFCNFSKSNAFGENFIGIKFIMHKILRQMSILSSRKTLRMFFNLCWKNCEKSFVGHVHFEGKDLSSDKNQYELFCKKCGFEYFSCNNFL